MSDPFDLSPATRAPLSVVVSQRLRDAIVSGQVSAGTELPSEQELAGRFGVGRSTIREAVRILQAQGLLSGGDTVSTRRPRVSSEEGLSSAASLAMENALRLGQIPLADLVELRVLLEGAMAEAAALAPREALAEAAAALAQMEGADLVTFQAADLRFHHGLALASGNAAMPLMMGVMRSAIAAHLGEALARRTDPSATTARLTTEHAEIFAAVSEGRSADARDLVSGHIRAFYASVGAA